MGYADQLNLYAYVRNDPLNAIDQSGEGTVYLYEDRIVVVQTFNNQSQFTDAQIASQGQNLSGTTSGGIPVTVVLVPSSVLNDGDAISITTDPSLNDTDPNGAMRSQSDPRPGEMNGIGSRDVRLAPNATLGTGGHEIGHGLGAGDQYSGGMGANGSVLTNNVPGPTNLMRDAAGSVNAQSVDEIVNAPTNTRVTCTSNVMESTCGP